MGEETNACRNMAMTTDGKICLQAVRGAVLAAHAAGGLLAQNFKYKVAEQAVRSAEGLLRTAAALLDAQRLASPKPKQLIGQSPLEGPSTKKTSRSARRRRRRHELREASGAPRSPRADPADAGGLMAVDGAGQELEAAPAAPSGPAPATASASAATIAHLVGDEPVQTLVLGDSVFVGDLTELGIGEGQLAAQAFGCGGLPGLQALASQHSPGARALLEQILAMSSQIDDQTSGTGDVGLSSIVP